MRTFSRSELYEAFLEPLTGEWVRANHAFRDVIYRAASAPLVERIAKNARRTFSGQAVWGSGRSDIDELYDRLERGGLRRLA